MSFEMDSIQMFVPINIWHIKFITVIQSTEPICYLSLSVVARILYVLPLPNIAYRSKSFYETPR
jgi:hypothetical protein